MELKEFISEALLNIVEGVDTANSSKLDRFKIVGVNSRGKDGNFVDFDISLAVIEESKGNGGVKGKLAFLNVVSAGISSDINMSKASTDQNVQHISFKVFITEK